MTLEPAPAPPAFGDRYEILADLGGGSFGRVFRARQRATGQEVAIKTLRTRDGDTPTDVARHVERLRREMRLCAQLSHPHIVRLLDSGEAEDSVYAVFEFVRGVTLREVLASEGKLDVAEAVRLMGQVLDALASAHAQDVVHRDLKPENIMITRTGLRRNALVLDFGLAGFVGELAATGARLTATQEMIGTPAYAAPEQLRGEQPTPRSDLYSWGLVLLECLTGGVAVAGATTHEVLMNQLGPEPVAIPDWLRRHRLGRLLEATTMKRVEERQVSAASLLETLNMVEQEAAGGRLLDRVTAPEGERRQLTIVACVTEVERADGREAPPDEGEAVLGTQHASYARLASPREGAMAMSAGDRTLLVFGYPRAHENDARRAVRTALHCVADAAAESERLAAARGLRIVVRIGVHSAMVVVNEGQAGFSLGGTAPQIAERLARDAAAGEVRVSEATHRLLRGETPCEPAGTLAGGGGTGALNVFRVRAEYAAPALVSTPAAETLLVERDTELAQLAGGWRAVGGGAARALVLVGEAGIGKSRLLRELRATVPSDAWLECRCVSENAESPLRPFADMLASLNEPVRDVLARHGLAEHATLPLFAGASTPAPPPGPAVLAMSPERVRDLTSQALLALIQRMAKAGPRVLAIEDLHWADPTTLEFLRVLVEELRSATVEDAPRLFLIGTARTEFTPPWGAGEVTTVSVPRLSRSGIARLVRASMPNAVAVSDEVLAQIATRTEGVPLFVEELTRTLAETGPEGVSEWQVAIPGTLRELLGARLDGLTPSARETAQVAAAIGREVRYALLVQAVGREEWSTRLDLRELIAARVVQQRRSAADESYVFRHALLRDAAYESMLTATRERVHRRIAATLRERFAELVERQPELLALHLDAGGETAAAVGQWLSGGNRALQRAAYAEARRHLERGLAAAARLPASSERTASEIELLTSLGTVMFSMQGWGAGEVEETFGRALTLYGAGDVAIPPKIFAGLIGVYITRGDREAIEVLLPHARRLAEHPRDVVDELTGLATVAFRDYWHGRHVEAQALLERAIPLYRQEAFRRYAREYGYDGGIFAFGYATWNLWALGKPERAETAYAEMMEHAGRSPDPHALAAALSWGTALSEARRDVRELALRAQRLVEVAGEQKLYLWLAVGLFGMGAVQTLTGTPDAAVDTIGQALDVTRLIGARTLESYYAPHLLHARLQQGRIAEGLALAEQTLALCRDGLAVCHTGEVLRLQGELLRADGRPDEALATLRKALAFSSTNGALGWELRAATSLARALAERGDSRAARGVLAPVYRRLDEGLEDGDALAARGFLEGLG
jgi:TOMM system kinase/cyclase fusion protein